MKLKKLLYLAAAIGMIFSLSTNALAYEKENTDIETVLELDENGKAGAMVGIVIYDDYVENYDLTMPEQMKTFNMLQATINLDTNILKSNSPAPRGGVIFHVGIEMTGKTDEYRMYYEASGVGITKASGYMKCKSTALLFATTYHDEYFSNMSIGTTFMSGESKTFTLPSGTNKVKVGWHGVSITDADGSVKADDKYISVDVG